MEQNIRQRLVGAGVLLALGVIFLSWLYEPAAQRGSAKRIPEPPPMPDVPAFIASEQAHAEQVDIEATAANRYQMPEPEPEVKVAPKPQLQSSGVPRTWALQMGVFANRDNANALVAKLRGLGYKSYSRHWVREGGQEVDGVYVGPMVDRADLMPLQKKLKGQVKLEGVVVRYHP
ncbi:SPOR domain-containing protein [Aestuariirhabdus sp. LZHN29]|uniref:SPOR domain-containing protein n=1 Tax=Aestuariirhabdus sp. LZHN29 TaxID=3417462 RepID=UPI003CE6C084